MPRPSHHKKEPVFKFIHTAPRIIQAPQTVYQQPLNRPVYFVCSAFGNPEPKIKWLRNGEMLTGFSPISNITYIHAHVFRRIKSQYLHVPRHCSIIMYCLFFVSGCKNRTNQGGKKSFLYLRRPINTEVDANPDEFSCVAKNNMGTDRSLPAKLFLRQP